MKYITDTLKELREASTKRQKEWDPEGLIDLSYRGNELAGEVGEACNKIKKLERERLGLRGSRTNPDELAEELADVIICTSLVALHYGIKLEDEVRKKFNKTSFQNRLTIYMEKENSLYVQ